MKHQKTIEQELHSFIKENNLLSDAKKILLALSGGADSVFMLHFFNRFKEKYKIKIAAIHVNHNLRGNESQRDENFCKYLCERLNIEFHLKSVDVKKNKGSASIEEAARNLRYKEIDKILKSSNSDLIATAHTRDDNTELFF